LVANLDAKITTQAFLYDLLILDRNIIVYQPSFLDDSVESLRLDLFIPPDDAFQRFTNTLLAHDSMSCVVASFDDIPGWIDSGEPSGSPPSHTIKFLHGLSKHAAQLTLPRFDVHQNVDNF
jgi:hypothetical protein